MNPDNIVVFLDAIQRTIIATKSDKQEAGRLNVTKSVILNVSPTQDKKLQVQLYPLFFREFTINRDEFPAWSYDLSAIVLTDVVLESNLVAQYKQMFQTATQVNADSGKVIKLFDDES